MEIQCVDNQSDFLSLREDWNTVWKVSHRPSYFLTHEWIRFCWEELRSNNAMRIFVVRDGSKPVLIAPWMRSNGWRKKLPVKLLGFIDHPESQLADVICLPTVDANEGISVLFRYLREEVSAEWDLIAFDKLPQGSPLVQWLRSARPYASDRNQRQSSCPVFVIPLGGSWEEYLSGRSTRFRKTLRNIANRVQRLGNAEVTCYSGKELSADITQQLFSISDASWKLTSGVAMTSSYERKRFFEELLRNLVTAENVRVWFLHVNGTAIASEIQVVDGTTIYALRSDYDERFSDSSPGVYLQMEILKSVFGGAHGEYNFGVGLNPYKARWTDQTVELLSFRLFNESYYGQLLRLIDQCKLEFPSFFKASHTFVDKAS